MTTPKEKTLGPCQGEATQHTSLTQKKTKKIYRVEAALKLPGGLNRFEAERIGDHCQNARLLQDVAAAERLLSDEVI